MIQAESINCALHDRVFTLPVSRDIRGWRAVLLTSGEGEIRKAEMDLPFSATSLVFGPWTSDMSLRIAAGSVGAHFTLSGKYLSNAIGRNAESSEIRLLADRLSVVQLDKNGSDVGDCVHAFDLIQREFSTRRNGSASMIEAQLRTVLVTLWRTASEPDLAPKSIGRTQAILQHYRQLVETNFRDHWPIQKYAQQIGISSDRLHDICSRNLGKSPRQLLHERIVHEASSMLENTTLSVEELSAVLGFTDSAYFSRFFKSRTGLPPATFRRKSLAGRDEEKTAIAVGFADWP